MLVHHARKTLPLRGAVGFVASARAGAISSARNEREGEIRRAGCPLGKTAADGKAAAIKQEAVIGVRTAAVMATGQHGDVNVRVQLRTCSQYGNPALWLERIAQLHQGMVLPISSKAMTSGFSARCFRRLALAWADFGCGRDSVGWSDNFDIVGGDAKVAA